MPRRALITGVTGFVGSHLAELLLSEGVEVHGTAVEDPPFPNLEGIASDVRIHRADLRDLDATVAAVKAAAPDDVYHLAAQAVPAASWRDPRLTFEINVLGTLDVLEGCRETGSVPVVALASTGEVYAPADETQLPLGEEYPLGPTTPYGASKVAQEALVRQYGRSGIVRDVVLRAANQLGPRLSRDLVASAFALQVAEAEAGGEPVVRVGNLEPRRDFIDVRDVARAYVAAARRPDGHPVYNVGTGEAVPIRTLLDLLVAESRVPLRVVADPSRQRPSDRAATSLDATRLRDRTGWAPAIPLRDSLRDTLEHWRGRVSRTARAGGPA